MIATLRQSVSGVGILTEWLGSGGEPVSQAQADLRAYVCQYCPMNTAPNWWERVLADPIAETIRRHLEAKAIARLEVPNESKLHMCSACGCCVKLKVWCPIKHVADHTPRSVYEQYPAACWVKEEIDSIIRTKPVTTTTETPL